MPKQSTGSIAPGTGKVTFHNTDETGAISNSPVSTSADSSVPSSYLNLINRPHLLNEGNGTVLLYDHDNSTETEWRIKSINAAGSLTITDDGAGTLTFTAGATMQKLSLLSDVLLTEPSSGQVLSYNGVTWVNQDIVEGTNYTLPIATASVLGGVMVGGGLAIDGTGLLSANVKSVAGRTGLVELSTADISGLANVAKTGSYNDLLNKPAIPAQQVNADWFASSGFAQILNKPSLSNVATTGSYDDLLNTPAAYVLPNATTSSLGGVIAGSGLNINNGTLSVTFPVTSVAGRTGDVVLNIADVTGAAPLASPAFSGVPTAPTATVGTNTTQIATTAFVAQAVAGLSIGDTGVTSLKNLIDVDVTETSDDDGLFLMWSQTDGKWKTAFPGPNQIALSDMTDVDVGAIFPDQMGTGSSEGSNYDGYGLVWNTTDKKWEATKIVTTIVPSDTTNVSLIWDNGSYSGTASISTLIAGNGILISRNESTGAVTVSTTDVSSGSVSSINMQTGTSYTLALSDLNNTVETNNSATNSVTVPSDSNVVFPVGTIINIRQVGTGQTTILADAGVVINTPETLLIRKQWGTVTLQKRAANLWCIEGNLQVAP